MATANVAAACDEVGSVLAVPPELSCADWADEHFKLPSEASNTSGDWKTTTVQLAILNSFGSDAIEKVDLWKAARVGGTKMCVIADAYQIAHKRRNVCFYQPTKDDSNSFVKNEIEPSIRDCEPWRDLLRSTADKSPLNTLSFKSFIGCSAYFRGGHSPNSFRRLTLDTVILDEVDGFNADIGKEGDPTTLSWGRVKNSIFKKQIQISTPTITGFSLIEKSSKAAVDRMSYHVECPHCKGHDPIHWGGTDVEYGFKWTDDDSSTVKHYCRLCGTGWHNGQLQQAVDGGFWLGEKGYKTKDGIDWTLNGTPAAPPRHVAFTGFWSAYSPFSSWSQVVDEFFDAKGDILKIQAFTNTTLGRTWDIKYNGTITAEAVGAIIPVEDVSDIICVTAGVDIQDNRIEVQYVGHDRQSNTTVLDYSILKGDMSQPQIYADMGRDIYLARFLCGERELGVTNACIDTQGHHTKMVHEFLKHNKALQMFVGINGNGSATYEMADVSSTYKGVSGSVFYSIGVNVIKQSVFTSIRNYDNEQGAFRIAATASLPEDYAKQLTVEKMEVRRSNGLDRVVFTNEKKARNEALDTFVYAMAAKAYIKQHRGRQGKAMFG